jgi:capsular exopolysaccharide synthesis family protein
MANSESSSDISLHFLDYWRVIRNRAPIILTIFMLTFMTGYFVTFHYMEKKYDATAQIRVAESDPNLGALFTGEGARPFNPIVFNREMEIIKSRAVIDPVVEKLNLTQLWAKRYFDSSQPITPLQAYLIMAGRHLDVSFTRNSDLIEIRGISADREEAARLANAIAEEYLSRRSREALAKFNKGLTELDSEIAEQEARYQAAQKKVEELRLAGGVEVIGMGQEGGMMESLESELSRKQQLLDEAKAAYIRAKVLRDELKALPIEQFLSAAAALNIDLGNISQLRDRQLFLESGLQNLVNSGLGPDHPRIQAARGELETVNQQIDRLIAGRQKALEIDVQVIESQMNELAKEVETLANDVRERKTTKLAPFQEAIKEREHQKMLLDALKTRRIQKKVDVEVGDEPVKIISKAEPSDSPFKPNPFLNLAIAGVMGLVLGIIVAFFIEYLDTSVKTMDDVEKFLGLPVLAVIPDGVSPLNVEGSDSPHAEGYRILRAKIDLSPVAGTGNTVTMLSGGPGEGKSTTLFNLAFVAAQAGQTVLLVDGDLRRPTLHDMLGIENEQGVADVFLGRGLAYEFIRATSIPNLHVISAGDMPSSEMGSFSGAKLREILDDLKLRYDLVLIDSPPVLGISDGSVIAHEADACLLVIQHRRYPRDISLRAKRAIEEVKGNLLGVVLNAVTIKSDEAYYYYSSYGDYYYKDKSRRSGKSKAQAGVGAQDGNGNGSDSY